MNAKANTLLTRRDEPFARTTAGSVRTLLAVVGLLSSAIAGCTVKLTDISPLPLQVSDATPGVGNDFGGQTPGSGMRLRVDRDPLVFERSISAKAVVDGVSHSMSGSGSGEWVFRVPSYQDANNQNHIRHGLQVKYVVDYQFLALPIPLVFRGSKSLPSQGTLYFDILPDVFLEKDDPIFLFGGNPKGIRLHNLSQNSLQITSVQFEAAPLPPISIGTTDPSTFVVVDPPPPLALPVTLAPSEFFTVTIDLAPGWWQLTSATLVIKTNNPNFSEFRIAVQGKSF